MFLSLMFDKMSSEFYKKKVAFLKFTCSYFLTFLLMAQFLYMAKFSKKLDQLMSNIPGTIRSTGYGVLDRTCGQNLSCWVNSDEVLIIMYSIRKKIYFQMNQK